LATGRRLEGKEHACQSSCHRGTITRIAPGAPEGKTRGRRGRTSRRSTGPRAARDLPSSKWKVDLLYLLARGVHRYSRPYDNLRGASKKVLTDSLRGRERDGFVDRTVYAEGPVRVEYSLTAIGWSATELQMALADWPDEHLAAVEQAVLRYREASVSSVNCAAHLTPREAA
jgi:DNA-binding HxlR family transcriptional regulator